MTIRSDAHYWLRGLLAFAFVAALALRSAAAPECSGALAQAEKAWRGKSCEGMSSALTLLQNPKKSGCSSAKDQTEASRLVGDLVSGLNFNSCGCDSLRSLLERVRNSDAMIADCSLALDIVAQSRVRAKCWSDGITKEAREVEARYLKRTESDECRSLCQALPTRIDALPATSKERGRLIAQCLGCSKTTQRLCHIGDGHTPIAGGENKIPSEILLARLRKDLEDQINEFRDNLKCREVSGCTELENQRVRKLTAYLEELHAASLTEDQRAQEESAARLLLRRLVISDDVAGVVLSMSPDELKGLSNLSMAAGSPETRELLAKKLQEFNDAQFKELIEALRSGVSVIGLIQEAAKLQGQAKQDFDQVVGVGMDETRLRQAYLQQLQENQFEIVRPPDPLPGTCNGCNEFWGVFTREMTSTRPPKWTYSDDVPRQFAERVETRKTDCQANRSKSGNFGCGAVMSIEVKGANTKDVVVDAKLNFIIRSANGVEVRERKLDPVNFTNDPEGLQTQQYAAQAMATSAAFAFDRLRGSEVVSTCNVNLMPAPYCGVSVADGDNMRDPPPTSGRIVMTGNCDSVEFQKSLMGRIRQLGLSDALVFPAQWPSANGDRALKCTLTLQAGTHRYEDMYTVAAFVLPTENCGGKETTETKWQHAGEQIAVRLVRYMAKFQEPRSPPPFLHSLYFSGARQLEYSNGRSGWEWAAGETGLIVAGVVFTGLAISARNHSDPTTADVSKANNYLGAAFTSFGLIIPLRAVAGVVFRE